MTTNARPSKPKRNGATSRPDAIHLLKADHREVEQLFEEFESTSTPSAKKKLAKRICAALAVHARIEETIFYPAAHHALGKEGAALLGEAEVEHTTLERLIADIEKDEDAELFGARVKVLAEYVRHHVKEEEHELMPKVKKTDLDLAELGERMAAEKESIESANGRANRRLTALVGAPLARAFLSNPSVE